MDVREINVNKPLNIEQREKGLDPDKYSRILKEYHMCIWSNRKINSREFIVKDGYLNEMIFNNGEHEIIFTPDSINNIFQNSRRKYNSRPEKEIVLEYCSKDLELKKLVDEFNAFDYTIGSSLIFPIKIDGQSICWTMNRARGILYKIHDRIDLTLKCIKMYYENSSEDNPLLSCLNKNKVFFDLFGDFKTYVDFFLLNDLVDENYDVIYFDSECSFSNPFPSNIEKYKEYLKSNIDFIDKRNKRINEWVIQWK